MSGQKINSKETLFPRLGYQDAPRAPCRQCTSLPTMRETACSADHLMGRQAHSLQVDGDAAGACEGALDSRGVRGRCA